MEVGAAMIQLNRLLVACEELSDFASRAIQAGRDTDTIDECLERLVVSAVRLAKHAQDARRAICRVAQKIADRKPFEWTSTDDTIKV